MANEKFIDMKKRINLSRRMGGVVLGVTIILMGILMLFVTKVVNNQTTKSYYQVANEIAAARSDEIDKWLEVYKNDLKIYTEADVVKTGDDQQIIEWLQAHTNLRNPDYDYMFYCTADGTSYRDTGLVGGKGALVTRDYHKAMMEEGRDVFVGNMVLSKTSGQYVLPIARIAKDANGRRIGYFVGMLGLEQIKNEIARYKIGDTGYFLLADRTNTIIAHKNPDLILSNLEIYPEVAEKIKENTATQVTFKIDGVNTVSFIAPIPDLQFNTCYMVTLNEIKRATRRTQNVIVIVGVLIGIAMFVLSFLIIKRIIDRLKAITKLIDELSTGEADLTTRLQVHINDEIGRLVISVNRFLEKFHSIMSTIKYSEKNLNSDGMILADEINTTTTTISQMIESIGMVEKQVKNQTKSVDSSASAVTQISQSIVSLDNMIQEQATSVVEASSAVEEMIGNINSVDKSVISMVEEFTVLEMDTKNGIEQNSSVNTLIQKIAEQSTSMLDANTTIQSIAEQTNLLAMNAAIEAAHAGEAGKGFSVVADEIRKLAETSAEESNKISEELTNIQNGIAKVVQASSESEKSFQAVSSRIGLTSELMTQIRGAMEEQQSGSQQILEALESMNGSTSEVRNAAQEMNRSGSLVLKEVTSLKNSMDNIENAVTEINSGTNYISGSTNKLRDVSISFTRSIKQIHNDVDLFKV